MMVIFGGDCTIGFFILKKQVLIQNSRLLSGAEKQLWHEFYCLFKLWEKAVRGSVAAVLLLI